MANRFSELSTSTYQPLQLQEIMMIPMAKQQMHDQAQAESDQYASLTAKRLSQDASVVDTRLGELRGSADEISQNLLEHGVSRDTMARIHSLKREKEKEFSQQGLIGNAQANYETATKFVNDLAEKKERQAGWSPAQAKQWASAQVAGFKGTLDDTGGFRGFSGQELDEFVDSNKWINENMAQVAADTGVIGLGKYANVNAFTDAWKHGTVEQKTKEKIIQALQLRAQYDPKLQASLQQSAFWTGEKTPTNVGDWKIIKDSNGQNRQVFKPGSYFGMQLLGAAEGAKYRKETAQYNFVKDDMGFKLWSNNLDKKEAEALVTAANGNLSAIPPANYEELKNNFSLAQKEIANSSLKLNALADNIKKREKGNNDPLKDPAYQEMLQTHNESKAKYNNAQFNLENIMNKANANLNSGEKAMIKQHAIVSGQVDRIAAGMPGIVKDIRGIVTGEEGREAYAKRNLNKLGITDAELKNAGIKPGRLSYIDIVGNPKLMKGLILQKNGALSQKLTAPQLMMKVNHIEQRDRLHQRNAQNYIKDNPMAQDYKVYDGSAQGAFKSVVGGYQKQLTDTFEKNNGGGWNIANGGSSLNSIITKVRSEADDKGISFQVMPTDGVDTMGYPIEQVVITNKKTGETTTIPATRGAVGRSTQKQVGQALMNNPEFTDRGSRMVKNAEFLPEVQALGINQNSYKGKVIPGREVNGKYVFVEKEYLKDATVKGAKGSVGNEAVYRVKLIDKKDWDNNRKVTSDQASQSLGGVNDVIDVLNTMKYNQ